MAILIIKGKNSDESLITKISFCVLNLKTGAWCNIDASPFEPLPEKTGFLPMQEQRRRSACEADQRLCFCYSESTIPFLLISEISSF